MLGPNEGYVVAMIRVNCPGCICALEPKDVPGKKFFFEDWFGFGPFMKKENFVAIRVRSGTYALSYFRYQGYTYYMEERRIRVEAGCVNCIGTLEIDGLSGAVGEPYRYRYSSDYARLVRLFADRYPGIAEGYRLVDHGPGESDVWKYVEGRLF